jgi:hypothetical protein
MFLFQVGMGRDHTLFSLVTGHVQFTKVARKKVDMKMIPPHRRGRKWVFKSWRKYISVVKSEPTQNNTIVLQQFRIS